MLLLLLWTIESSSQGRGHSSVTAKGHTGSWGWPWFRGETVCGVAEEECLLLILVDVVNGGQGAPVVAIGLVDEAFVLLVFHERGQLHVIRASWIRVRVAETEAGTNHAEQANLETLRNTVGEVPVLWGYRVDKNTTIHLIDKSLRLWGQIWTLF